MKLFLFCPLVVLLAYSPLLQAEERVGSPISIAVFDVEAKTGVPPETADLITDSVSAAIREVPGHIVIAQSEVNAMLDLEKQKQMMGCKESGCVVEIAGALGVDKIVVGSVGKLGQVYALTLRLINMQTAVTEKQSYRRFTVGEGEELFAAADDAVVELFGQFKRTKEVGSQKPEEREKALDRLASERSGGEGIKTAGWVMVSAGVASTIAGTILFVMAKMKYDEYDAYEGSSSLKLKELEDSVKNRATGAYVGWGIGGALVTAGAVLLVMNAMEGKEKEGAKTAYNLPMGAAVFARGGGLSLNLRF